MSFCLSTSINKGAFRRLHEYLTTGEGDLSLCLSSSGGSSYAALAMWSMLRRQPVPITAYGLVASAAVLVLAAGSHRRMAKDAWVMVHEDTVEDSPGEVHELERDIKHYRALETQWCKLLASVTKTSAKVWGELHRKTTYLTAQECLKLGLIDEII